MAPQDRARLEAGLGLVGNADQGGQRQVTLLSQERWLELTQQTGAALEAQARRANLLLSGVDLANSRGRVLRIGACRVRVRGETRGCTLMDETRPGLRSAMAQRWGGGVFAEVLDSGDIAIGDPVDWMEPTPDVT